MKIIIAGAGEVGTHLAKMLSQEKQDIILMEHVHQMCMIATIMGLDRAIRCGNQSVDSVYNHRGILFI